MSQLRRFASRLRDFFRPGAADRAMRRELESHLALLAEDFRRRGLSPDDAGRAARRALGGVERVADLHRDTRSLLSLEEIRRDTRHAIRSLARSPGFTAVALLTMALGVGATTTLFSLGYGVLGRPLPWPDPDRLMRLEERRGGRPGRIPWTISNAAYFSWRDNPATIEGIGVWRTQSLTLSGEGDARQLAVAVVTPSIFRILRAQPAVGRLFVDGDAATPADAGAIILGFSQWQRSFGGRPDVIGHAFKLDGRPYTVVGVMPRGFLFPDRDTQAWLPMAVLPVGGEQGVRRVMIAPALVRLRPGVTPAQAAAEGTARSRAAADIGSAALSLFGSGGEAGITVTSASEVLTSQVRPALVLMLAAVCLLFLAATASVVLLQAARAASRRREMAVRMAIGAGIGRIARGWLIESLLLGVAAGAAGILLSILAHRALPSLLPGDFPRLDDVRVDGRVGLFAAVISCFAGIASGLVPAFQAGRTSLTAALTAHGPAQDDGTGRTAGARLRTVLMGTQVAVACVLLAASGLLGRSFVALQTADRGFDPHNLLTARVPLPPQSTFTRYAPLLDAIEARLRLAPGVTHVAFGNALPFVTTGGFRGVTVPSAVHAGQNLQIQAMTRAVTPAYFGALRLRLIAGRPLDPTDTPASRPVIVVNRSFAAQYLGREPIGATVALNIGEHRDWEVVGVIDDMRQGGIANTPQARFGGLSEPLQPEAFFAAAQWPSPISEVIAVMRTSGDPVALAPILRQALHEENASLALDSIMTMDERVMDSLARPKTYTLLVGVFAASALAIATVGLFGVLSYATARRTREIGVRTALGARPRDIVSLVVRQGLSVTMVGIVCGLALAYGLAQSMSSLVYGVLTRDAVSFAAPPLVLLAAALVACAAPARRAARVDPVIALRADD